MQYDVKTPAEYMDALEKDWRLRTLQFLREIIKEKAPGLTEKINYKMLAFGDERGIPFHLNAQMNYVSLYTGDSSKVDPEGELLKGLSLGKGCIRFKKGVKVQDTRIDEFIEKAYYMWQDGHDIDC